MFPFLTYKSREQVNAYVISVLGILFRNRKGYFRSCKSCFKNCYYGSTLSFVILLMIKMRSNCNVNIIVVDLQQYVLIFNINKHFNMLVRINNFQLLKVEKKTYNLLIKNCTILHRFDCWSVCCCCFSFFNTTNIFLLQLVELIIHE